MLTTRTINREAAENDLPTAFSILESLPAPSFIIKTDGSIQAINTPFARQLGKTPDDCLGRNIYELISSEHRTPALARHLQEKSSMACQEGRRIVFQDDSDAGMGIVSVNPLFSASGSMTSLFVSLQDVPEQHDAVGMTMEAGAENSALLDNLPCLVAIFDTDQRLVSWNRYAQELLSGDGVDLRGISLQELFDKESSASLTNQFHGIVSTGEEHDDELRVRPQDGLDGVWLSTCSKKILFDGRSCVVMTGIDITDEKRIRETLKEYEDRHALSMQVTQSGVWEWDARNDVMLWSDQIWTLYGLVPGSKQLTLQRCIDMVCAEDREIVAKRIMEAVRLRRTVSVEYPTLHSDGSIRWLAAHGIPMCDAHGTLIRYTGSIIDITERKKIELELIENRKRLSEALEAAHAGVWQWNPESGETIWSDEIWSLHGLSRQAGHESSFSLWVDAIHPEDRDMVDWVVNAAARKQGDLNFEYRTIHADGSVHWLMSRGKPRYDDHGKSLGYVGTCIDITDRKVAEIRLNENRFRFNFALEATGAGIWEWDVRTDRIFWSDQIWKLYGLERQGSISSYKLCSRNVHAEDYDLTFHTIMSAVKRKVDFTVEYRVCHPDGSIRWLMCRGVPQETSGSDQCSFLGMVMDITDRKRVEEEWRKSQNKVNLVIEQGNIGVWTVDLRDFSAQRSLQYARIFGYDSADGAWSLETFLNHIVPDERESVREEIERCCINHLNHTFECRILTADDRLRWIWVFGTFNYDMSIRTYYLSGIVQDITVRKQAEMLLRESEQKFRNIFEFSPVAIGIGDLAEGVLFDVNASWLALFGYSREELVGRRLGELDLYLHREDHGNIMHDIQVHGRVSNRQLVLRNKAGKRITILFSAETITIAGQRNIMLMMTDITVQELQQASISQLETAVAERTAQLQEEVERLRRFLSMISHEYRTPLAIIRGNLDLINLKNKNAGCSNEREMNKIARAIDRLVEVMEVSIQESRLLGSQEVLCVTNFPVESAIVSQTEAFRFMWPERTIAYTGTLASTEIFGELGQFKMAIFNLLDNARKYSPPDSTIELEGHVEEDEVCITIRNQGKLITNAECDELFDKYRRGSNAANTGGAGIGLWLVRDIIEHHHGKVTLSVTGKGVEAMIRLPLAGSNT